MTTFHPIHPMQIALPAIALASLTSGTFVMAQISAETKIPLGEALAAFVFIAALVAWLSRKLQKIDDTIKANHDAIEDVHNELKSRPCMILPGSPSTVCPIAAKKEGQEATDDG